MIPFMMYVPSLYMHCSRSSSKSEAREHHERLTNILTACNMQRHLIPGDGNCCFTTVAFRSYNFALMNDEHKQISYTCLRSDEYPMMNLPSITTQRKILVTTSDDHDIAVATECCSSTQTDVDGDSIGD